MNAPVQHPAKSPDLKAVPAASVPVQEGKGEAKAKAERVVNTVTMSDGRKVDFVGKRKLLKTVTAEPGKQATVRFDLVNGETRTYHIPHEMLHQFAAHGAAQKIGDECAGEDDVDDMTLAIDSIIERLNAGKWNAERESSGDSYSGGSTVIRAIVEVSGKSVADVKAFLDATLKRYEDAGQKVSRQALYKSFRTPGTAIADKIAELEASKKSKEPAVNVADIMKDFGLK